MATKRKHKKGCGVYDKSSADRGVSGAPRDRALTKGSERQCAQVAPPYVRCFCFRTEAHFLISHVSRHSCVAGVSSRVLGGLERGS